MMAENNRIRVLLDTGVVTHAEFAQGAKKPVRLAWGDKEQVLWIQGFMRKPPHKDAEYEAQQQALFTIGRLIREGVIEAFTYNEIEFELMNGRRGFHVCNALQNCTVHRCPPALERSRFRQANFAEFTSKGGKKDQKSGQAFGGGTQIAFLSWLCTLTREQVDGLIPICHLLHLSEFEVDSLRDLAWFQLLCTRSGSRENYPDIFHLWTAERNGLDAVLTLERRLPNFVRNVRTEKRHVVQIRTQVLRPIEMLQHLGIHETDPVPLEPDRFYYFHQLL